jgi:DNA-binding MarR family transcriptional regulator
MRLLSQHYTQVVDASMREAGFGDIRPGDAKVFPFVPPDGITIGDLAVRAAVRKQTMGEAVEQLERSGYVERRPNPRDARSRLVFLTGKGRSVQPVARAAGDRAEKQWARLTSPEEIEALRSGLLRLVQAIQAGTPAQ